MLHAHHDWLASVGEQLAKDYNRLHAAVSSSPGLIQQSGHGAESSWVRLLAAWLPPGYEVGTRKYILGEEGDAGFETDIVVFRPGYPPALRDREEVLAAGVAAAFSVKLTLDRAGLAEAHKAAAILGAGLKKRIGTPRGEMQRPFAYGVLAHSHAWKSPDSKPSDNVGNALWELDIEYADHPRKSVDYVCVADLGMWRRLYVTYLPPLPGLTARQQRIGYASTAMIETAAESNPAPVAMLVGALYERLSADNSSLRPIADGLRLTGTTGEGSGPQRLWELDDIYEPDLVARLAGVVQSPTDPDWRTLL